MLLIALASLRRRKSALVGGFLALFCAAAMVCACGALLETGIHGRVPPQRYAGAPTIVTADQQIHWTKVKHKHGKTKTKTKSKQLAERAWAPAAIGAKLRAIPGATVVPDRSFIAEISSAATGLIPGANGRTLGHNWQSARLTPYRLIAGHAPGGDRQIVLDQGLARRSHAGVGSRVVVQSTSAPTSYVVSGVAVPRRPVTEQSAVFFSDAQARRLAKHGAAVTAYGVFGVSAESVREALRGTTAQVATGEARGIAEFPSAAAARAELTSMGGAMGGTALIVAMLVVVGIFSLSVQQRHRELALLRAVGATPRQVRRLISREALLLALVAAIPGAVTGLPLARLIVDRFVSAGALPDTVVLTMSPLPVVAAALVTILASLAAVRISTRRIGRISPVDALGEAVGERRGIGAARGSSGLLCTAAAAAITGLLTRLHTEPAAMPVTYLCALLWLVAAVLLGPMLARGAIAVLGVPARLSAVGGFLAVQNSRLRTRRIAAVVTPLALLIGMTATIAFVPATMAHAARAQASGGLLAGQVVRSVGPGVPDSVIDGIRRMPGVKAAVPVRRSTIWVGQDKRSTEGVGTDGLTRAIDPLVLHGSLGSLHAGTIAMSTVAAQGRSIGSTVRVTLGDGTPASYRLVAVYARGLGFGDTLLSWASLRGHVDDPLAAEVLIDGPGAESALRQQIDGVAGLQLTDRESYLGTVAGHDQGNAGVSLVFLVLIVAFSSIAAINTLALDTMNRSREFSLVRLVGATVRQVRSCLRWELSLLLLTAAAVGSGAAWATLTGFSVGMTGASTPTIVPRTVLLILTGSTAIAALGTFVPAGVLLRRHAVREVADR